MQTAPGASLNDATPSSPPGRRGLFAALALFAIGVFALDQATKALAVARLARGETVSLLGDLLQLQLTRNPGAAFSFATGMTWVLTLVAITVVVVVARSARRIGSLSWAVALGLLLGGAAGNLTDRLLREPGFGRGHVVDFIAYGDLFIGNIADVAIVSAAVLVVLLGLRGRALDGSRTRPRSPDEQHD